MPASARVVRVRAEHPAELLDHLTVLEPLDRRAGEVAGRLLLDPEVALGERGDLREVRDADHLARLREPPQPLADRARGLPADARIDLVEHERLASAGVRDAHQGEHRPRQLAARSRLAQRSGGHAGVRRDRELDALRAGRAQLVPLLEDGLERGVLHGERAELVEHARRQLRRRLAPHLREPAGKLRLLGDRLGELRLEAAQRHVHPLEPLALGAAAVGVGDHGLDASSVLAH